MLLRAGVRLTGQHLPVVFQDSIFLRLWFAGVTAFREEKPGAQAEERDYGREVRLSTRRTPS